MALGALVTAMIVLIGWLGPVSLTFADISGSAWLTGCRSVAGEGSWWAAPAVVDRAVS